MSLIAIGALFQRILLVRGQEVMPDADPAELYGIPAKRFNEQVKRDIGLLACGLYVPACRLRARGFEIAICGLENRSRRTMFRSVCLH